MTATTRARRPLCLAGLALLLAWACGSARAAGQAHQHGQIQLDVAVDGPRLTIAMTAPLDNLLGFERAPRTEAERRAATALLARLRALDQVAALFGTDAAAQCSLRTAEVRAPVLEAGSRSADRQDHAELEASYELSCARPAALRSLELRLFDAYPRLQRIDVQLAGPQGQSRTTLKRPARQLRLLR